MQILTNQLAKRAKALFMAGFSNDVVFLKVSKEEWEQLKSELREVSRITSSEEPSPTEMYILGYEVRQR